MPPTLDELFAAAAHRIRRFTPAEALASNAAIVDLRSQDARERDGAIPGAYHVPRSVLEWRIASPQWQNAEPDGRALVLVCEQGYSSVFAPPRSSSWAATQETSRAASQRGAPPGCPSRAPAPGTGCPGWARRTDGSARLSRSRG